jgi:allantoinase
VSLGRSFDVQEDDLYYRHAQTPYFGRRLRGRIVRTVLRGRTVFNDDGIVAQLPGRLIRSVK